uniref:Uncharacterized protein n=1 Tax=Glossina austeni TaxID=7395 RepID=A0A1A9UQT8_GLOAU
MTNVVFFKGQPLCPEFYRQYHRSLENTSVSKRNIFSDAQQTFIGGGLEKFQGGIKEEKYFLSQNNELILKMREQGAKLKCEKSHQSDCDLSDAAGKKSSDYLAFRETCSPNKHKNFQEEAFFLHEAVLNKGSLTKMGSPYQNQHNTVNNTLISAPIITMDFTGNTISIITKRADSIVIIEEAPGIRICSPLTEQ